MKVLKTNSILFDKNNIIDYILIYLLVSLSGNQAYGISLVMVTLFFSFGIFLYRKRSFDIFFIFLILILMFILLMQALIFDFLPLTTLLGFFSRIFMIYFVIKSIGNKFIDKFVKFMVFFAVISLVFFFLSNIISDMPHYMKIFALKSIEELDSVDKFQASYFTPFYNFRYMPYSPIPIVRNPGMFWEAGAFGGYLIVTLLLNIMKNGILLNKQNYILMMTILTTVSTTSFIALMALSFFYMLISSQNKMLKTIVLPILILISMTMFTYLDFLGAKIEQRINLIQDPNIIHTRISSRFVDAMRDIAAFKGHEIFGRGINLTTRFSELDKKTRYKIRTNGLTDFLVRFGSIFFIFTFILLYYNFLHIIKYFKKLNKLFALYAIFVIILILQSETFFLYPIFWSLLLLIFIYPKRAENIDTSE